MYALAFLAYFNGFAIAGSCSASTSNHPSYPALSSISNMLLKSTTPSPGTVNAPNLTPSKNDSPSFLTLATILGRISFR